jgi:hypothetical protein
MRVSSSVSGSSVRQSGRGPVRPAPRSSQSQPQPAAPGKAREYILYGWQPPPFYRLGPYHAQFTEKGLCCTPRPGTRAYRRMVAEQAQQQQLRREVLFIGLFFAAWVIAVVFLR